MNIEEIRKQIEESQNEIAHLNDEIRNLNQARDNMTEETYNSELEKINHYIENAQKSLEENQRLNRAYDNMLRNIKRLNILDDYAREETDRKNFEERERLEGMIVKHNLQNQFFLKGYSDNIMDKYSEYAFFVLTSRYEGFGMVILEALANNLPVIAFDCDAGPEEIINNNNGYLIECFDIQGMATAIEHLIQDKEKRKVLSSRTKSVLDKFLITSITEQWKELI